MERTKEQLVVAIKAICSKMGVRPKLYESLKPESDGRIEISVSCECYLEDEHDEMLDALNDLTYKDPKYVVSPSGRIHFGGTPEQSGMKQIF